MRPALFLHIQKTAGTSVQEMARYHYGNDNVCSHGDFLHLDPVKSSQYKFLSGHFGIAYARQHMTDRYCFTFLRDPIARLTSLYRFCHNQESEQHILYAAAQGSFRDFLSQVNNPDIRPFLLNNMVWQLADGWTEIHGKKNFIKFNSISFEQMLSTAKVTLTQFDYVGFVETFESDICTIFRDLGAKEIEVRRSNVTSHNADLEKLDQATCAELYALTYYDYKLYKHAWQTYAIARVNS